MTNFATTWNREDRDLLVELRTEMKGVRADIKQLTDGNDTRLNDHETRLRKVEGDAGVHRTQIKTVLAIGAGVFAVFQVVVQIGLNYLKG